MQKIRQDKGLGGNIRDIRKSLGMTQDDVVAKLQIAGCDISRSIYSQIECGSYNIRVRELIALKQVFKVDYNAFFENLENPENEKQA